VIVKATLAGALLASSVGLIAPIALAAGGDDTCVVTPNEPTPTDCKAPADVGGELAGADEAVARALRLVGGHGYYQLCARLAANIWGRPRAGYFSAA